MKEYYKFIRINFFTNKRLYIIYSFLLVGYVCMEILFPVLTGEFINLLVEKKDFNAIIVSLVLIATIGLINQLLSLAKTIFYNKYSEYTKNELRLKIIDIVRHSKYEDLNIINSASFTQRVNLDLAQIISFVTDSMVMFFLRLIQFVVVLVYIFTLDYFLGLLTILFLPIYAFVYYIFKKKLYNCADKAKNATAEYYDLFNSQVNNIDDIIHSGRYEFENTNFNNGFLSYFRIFKDYIIVNLKFDFSQGIVALLLNVVMFAICANRIVNGDMKVGTLTVLMSFFTMLLSTIGYVFDTAKKYQLAIASLDKIMAIFKLKQYEEGGDKLEEKVENITAKIKFGYGEELLYKDLKVDFSSNNIYGVLGFNGKGKSTLYKILMGIIKSEDSCIKINNIIIDELDTVFLRKKHIFFVKQNPTANKVSIGEYFLNKINITSFNEIKDMLIFKEIYSDLLEKFLKEKWDYAMDELSGGDLKTVYLIESFLTEKEVKIYDEPTTNLDIDRRSWFIDAIAKVREGNIIIVITHDEELYPKFNNTIILDKISG